MQRAWEREAFLIFVRLLILIEFLAQLASVVNPLDLVLYLVLSLSDPQRQSFQLGHFKEKISAQ